MTTLSACVITGGTKQAPGLIQASNSCPWLPADIRREAARFTDIPAHELKKSDVLNLFRKYANSETRKNLTIKRVADLYDACITTLKTK